MKRAAAVLDDPLLEPARFSADPPADTCIAKILGDAPAAGCDVLQFLAPRKQPIDWVNRQFGTWKHNSDLAQWAAGADAPPGAADALRTYLDTVGQLPEWMDPVKVARAQELFMDYSLLSCILLFCASLPQCYVVPDLAAVLHAAGQLEQHTEHRIRATAAMVFPVMMRGGLTAPDGSGIAQIAKVRLIHATIRNMVLRGQDPGLVRHGEAQPVAAVPAFTLPAPATNLYEALTAMGWDVDREGLPCNQEELAYTLLTFSYVFLRALRRLGLRLPDADERAYLHGWNVVGHVLGIRSDLMAHDMKSAGELFARIQARGRARPVEPDARPALAGALIRTMEDTVPLPWLHSFPLLMTRYLCGRRSARDLGLHRGASPIASLLFVTVLVIARVIDTTVRLVKPEFAISRFITRLFGYSLVTRLLLDQTRPLLLPERLLEPVRELSADWEDDRGAPRWLLRLERRLAGRKAPEAAGANL